MRNLIEKQGNTNTIPALYDLENKVLIFLMTKRRLMFQILSFVHIKKLKIFTWKPNFFYTHHI